MSDLLNHIIQNLYMSPIPQTSFLVGTFFAVSYSKPALGVVALGGHFVELLQELDFYEAFFFH